MTHRFASCGSSFFSTRYAITPPIMVKRIGAKYQALDRLVSAGVVPLRDKSLIQGERT